MYLFINQKLNVMKNLLLLVIISGSIFLASCNKSESERFKLLTGPVWVTDSLLANGFDATGPGGILTRFLGDAKFKTDKTGYFGHYKGTWRFNIDETQLIIVTDTLPLPITADIKELTTTSLKITSVLPNPVNPLGAPYNIRMTFKAK